MKKITPLFLFILFATTGYTQSQFPAGHPEILLNKNVKITELAATLQEYGYRDFHKNEEMKITDKAIKHSQLAGKDFRVASVEPYEKYGKKKFKIKLESAENGIYFYDYDPRYDHNYNLFVEGGITLPEGIYCEDITTETDKFNGDVKTYTPYSEGIALIKNAKAGKTTIYLSINEIGSTLNVGKKGLILLLENGKKIERPDASVDVKVESGGKGYVYSVFITLTQEEIKLLSENSITDNRLYIYDGTIKNGIKIKEYLKCLLKN